MNRPVMLPMTAAVSAARVAEYLKKCGIDNKGVTEATDVMDGEVNLGRDIHVQVGRGYAAVCAWNAAGQTFYHGVLRYDAADLIADIEDFRRKTDEWAKRP